jgi:mannose-6-phosphate isomerase
MLALYPMVFKPVLKDYIWGGRNLENIGRKLPEKVNIAESWEISSHPDGMTEVKNGIYAGKSIPELLDLLGEDLIGTKNSWALDLHKFPLLVKLLDANQRLSVQVHPNDTYAREHEVNELGKTEMWVVLYAKPDAKIIYGLSKKTTPNAFHQAILKGNTERYLNWVSIKAGDHICVPSGTLHAICEGALIAEIQQNSNTTYRVYDWNRLGADDQPRTLHVDKALDVINFDQVALNLSEPEIIEKCASWICERLCQNKYFTTDRYLMNSGARFSGFCDGSTFEIWGVLSGAVEIAGYRMTDVQFVLLPAALGAFEIFASEDSVLLRTHVD